jgi:hypothetical protein
LPAAAELLPTVPLGKRPNVGWSVPFPSSKQAATSTSGSPSMAMVRKEWFMAGLGFPTCIAQAEGM